MMNRFNETFQRTIQENRAALIGYITAGDPDMERSFEILDAACGAGLDILELGIPFSNPSADGPTIQRSMNRAIQSGMTLEKGLDLVKRLRKRHELPIVIFTYHSPVLAMETERFVKKAIEAGADGMLIVDLPAENADEVLRYIEPSQAFSLIRLVTPTIDPTRCRKMLAESDGFVYVVSRRGVTGPGKIDWNALSAKMGILRNETTTPLCIGFGISTPDDVRSASQIADGVIVGSAFQRMIEEHPNTAANDITNFIRELCLAVTD